MKTLLWIAVLASSEAFAASGFYALSAENIDGLKQPLSTYAGKVTLVVNTASECGYTPQYKDLEALYRKYKDKGLVVLGFPSNDFGGQEPGSNAEIKKFCTMKYKVSFPMFSKNPVKGPEKQPTFAYLTEKANPSLKGEVDWNFEKFLINKKGELVGRYKSKVSPTSNEIETAIVTALQ